jgi:hypothetical protein
MSKPLQEKTKRFNPVCQYDEADGHPYTVMFPHPYGLWVLYETFAEFERQLKEAQRCPHCGWAALKGESKDGQ